MNKQHLIFLLIVSVLIISGCAQQGQQPSSSPKTAQSSAPVTSQSTSASAAPTKAPLQSPVSSSVAESSSPATTSLDPNIVNAKWIKVEDSIVPKIVYKDELYGVNDTLTGNGLATYKLVNDKWVEFASVEDERYLGTESRGVYPKGEFNGNLFGLLRWKSILVVLVNNTWVNIVKYSPTEASPKTFIVHNGELYAQGRLSGGSNQYEGPYKLVDNKWVQVGDKEEVKLGVSYNGDLYGIHPDIGTVKLVGDKWIQVDQQKVIPTVVYNGSLYGWTYAGTYKLVENKWEKVTVQFVIPVLEFDGDLYGKADGKTYKLVGSKWIAVRADEVIPVLVYKGDLYGTVANAVSGGTYKLVSDNK